MIQPMVAFETSIFYSTRSKATAWNVLVFSYSAAKECCESASWQGTGGLASSILAYMHSFQVIQVASRIITTHTSG